MIPFNYPAASHVRKHGPGGYSSYESYRPWLRDEFIFRCVYCLQREKWGKIKAAFHIDHYTAQTHDSTGILDYDNLLYSCATCNTAKGKTPIPDPCSCLLSRDIKISEDGRISGSTPDAKRIIGKLGLNSPDYREFRRLRIDIVNMELADKSKPSESLSYPSDLPDLASLRSPGNSRPNGVDSCFYNQRKNGDLPDTY